MPACVICTSEPIAQLAGNVLVMQRPNVHYGEKVPGPGAGEGIMDELIGRLVAAVGVERTAAETAVGIVLDFLAKEGPADKVQLLLAKLPGAEALMQKAVSVAAATTLRG